MKNQKLNLVMLLLLTVTSSIFSCDDDDNQMPKSCDTSNSLFKQLYNDIKSDSLVKEIASGDLEVHSYKFKVNSDKQLCSFGYQSFAKNTEALYKIEILDAADSSQVYFGKHNFSKDKMSYVEVDSVVSLKADKTYILKRIFDTHEYFTYTIGNQLTSSKDILPHKYKDLEILSSSFYDAKSTRSYDQRDNLPAIDIVFY